MPSICVLLADVAAPTSAPAVEALASGAALEDLRAFIVDLAYAGAALCFIFGLKMLSSPRTARKGNFCATLGMLIAILVTLIDRSVIGYGTLIAGLVVGGAIGAIAARRVAMTSMPEMVALFNGSGGAASALVALSEFFRHAPGELRPDTSVSAGLSVLIGLLTVTGSLVAFGKLQGRTIAGVRLGNPLTFSGQHPLNLSLLLVAAILLGVLLIIPDASWSMVLLVLIAVTLGVLLTIPIGGADMPVVVSLLNSYSGVAACATGFVLQNKGLIISGALVGAAGLILTHIMCVAMDRSLIAVLAGGFGQDSAAAGSTQAAEGRTVRKMDAEEAAMLLEAAQSVVIVPGYGMAVAQAQHAVAELDRVLSERGCKVRYAIHPVAGRMPGHMNVLLAEANVPYDKLFDLELNSEMAQTDAVLVIGANDVVNPDARDNPGCTIYGMPIFEVDKARTVMVSKRSLNPGFAGIENPLFFKENTVMLFGDAKKMITDINSELKGR